MRRLLRENALAAFMALTACAALAWLGLTGFAWSDYELEALPAVEALVHGHLASFLRLAPSYGGSLIERAPFALLANLWGGGSLAVYRMLAVPGLLASAALGVYLVASMRARGHATLGRAVALGVCVANPITLNALEYGHPEELLGGCMCVAALLLAGRGRTLLAGAVLGLAIANKQWAVLAVGPVLLALPLAARARAALAAGGIAATVLAPLVLVSGTAGAAAAPGSSVIFQPWQAFWFLGSTGHIIRSTYGVKADYRAAPSWINQYDHPAIILVGVTISLAVWLATRSRRLSTRDALQLFALLMLLRCVLDTWDTGYYTLPFLLALVSWEALGTPSRPPVLSLASTVLIWLTVDWMHEYASPDVNSLAFMAWTLPLCCWLGMRVFASARLARSNGDSRGDSRQEMTVRSLDRLVSTS
jgi:hypothetical protein